MTREELLRCPEYWTTLIQNELYRQIQSYMEEHNMNKSQLAEHLGCSRGYVTQLLNGDFDHKVSKLVELSLAIGMVPSIEFKDLEHVDDAVKFQCNGIIKPLPKFSYTANNLVVLPMSNTRIPQNRYSSTLGNDKMVG